MSNDPATLVVQVLVLMRSISLVIDSNCSMHAKKSSVTIILFAVSFVLVSEGYFPAGTEGFLPQDKPAGSS